MTGGATTTSSFDLNNDDKFESKDSLPSGGFAAGAQFSVGMVKSLVWLDKEGTGIAVKEGSGTSSNIESIKNKGQTVSAGTANRLYWLQIQ